MKRLSKYNYILYISLRLLILLDIVFRFQKDVSKFLIFSVAFILIMMNDYFRLNKFNKNINIYYISMLISIVGGMTLIASVVGYSFIYSFIILYELILINKTFISLIGLELFLMLVFMLTGFNSKNFSTLFTLSYWQNNILDILMYIIFISFYIIMLFVIKALVIEKKKVEKLNEELKQINIEIENLTKTKERNRIAGEIHDNLGHNLMALNMQLDVAYKLTGSSNAQIRDIITKAQALTKTSIDDLRKAVYALKESSSDSLSKAIRNIVDNINNIEIELSIDKKIDYLLANYKNDICLIVKEAITNSIKHGNADKIFIAIKVDNFECIINIHDNGKGCSKLIKGNGLLGIEEKVNFYNGHIIYLETEKAFSIMIKFPLSES